MSTHHYHPDCDHKFSNLIRLAAAVIALLVFTLRLTPGLSAAENGRARCLESTLHTLITNSSPEIPIRPLDQIQTLRIASYNLLNLQEHVGKFRYAADGTLVMKEGPRLADLAKLAGKARAIREINPDILVVQEVEGGLETLQKFADERLGHRFNAFLLNGNDSRGINIGFLVKKDLPITVEMETHRDLKWIDPTHRTRTPEPLYSRDLPAMIVRPADQARNEKPLLIVLGNHSKSQRSRPGDPNSVILRRAQAAQTAAVVKKYQERYGPDARIVVGGDFNTDVHAPEMQTLSNGGLTEAFEASKVRVAPKNRVTHTYHPRDGPRELSQLDAFYLSPGLKQDVSRTFVYRYKNDQGHPIPLPRTFDERELNPSDHFPLVMDLDFKSIRKSFKEQH